MKPIILFRADSETKDEFFVAQKYFEVTKNRNAIPADRLVIVSLQAFWNLSGCFIEPKGKKN